LGDGGRIKQHNAYEFEIYNSFIKTEDNEQKELVNFFDEAGTETDSSPSKIVMIDSKNEKIN